MPTMTGIYGEPLELVKTWLEGLASFGSFGTAPAVYLYERTGTGDSPAIGAAWATLAYKEDGFSIGLVPGLDISRTVEMTLVRCVRKFTEDAKAALVTDAGSIVQELIEAAEPAGVLTKVVLKAFALDDEADPPRLGAVFHLSLDLGGQ